MWISQAYAQAADMAMTPGAPSAGEAFAWNMGLIVVMVVLFYLLLIRPQQSRMKEHAKMLSALKKGDAIITSGGLVGKIDKVIDDREVVLDLGNGTKVTALRTYIQGKNEGLPHQKPANDAKDEEKKKG